MLRVSMQMSYGGNQNFILLRYILKSIRKTLHKAASCSVANFGPCSRHELYSVNCRIHFLEKSEAQPRQLVVVIPDGFIQLGAGRREETNFQRSYLFLISSQSRAPISPRL